MSLLSRHLPLLRIRLQGFTLLEVVVVLAVLAVAAGLILSRLGSLRFAGAGQDHSSEEVATAATLGAVRDAILGTPGQPGLWQDLGERQSLFPRVIADLFVTNNFSTYAFPSALQNYDPVTCLGWRGAYLAQGGTLYAVDLSKGFTSDYGSDGDPGVSDAWGRPIVLQIPTIGGTLSWPYARLVSAGPDGKIDSPLNLKSPSDADRNDDILLFLFVTDTHGQP